MVSENEEFGRSEALRLAGQVVAAFISHNAIASDKLPGLLQQMYDAVRLLAKGSVARAGDQIPAVPVMKSVTPDCIVCLEDGKRLKMLKRYLRTHYGLSPEDYRRKWGLPADYPMVAPNYAKKRSNLAKEIGLGAQRSGQGRKGRETRKKTAKRRGRPKRAV